MIVLFHLLFISIVSSLIDGALALLMLSLIDGGLSRIPPLSQIDGSGVLVVGLSCLIDSVARLLVSLVALSRLGVLPRAVSDSIRFVTLMLIVGGPHFVDERLQELLLHQIKSLPRLVWAGVAAASRECLLFLTRHLAP